MSINTSDISSDNQTVVVFIDQVMNPGIVNNNGYLEMDIWKNSISSEFPIVHMKIDNKKATCMIGQPHLGFTIESFVINTRLNGKARILDQSGNIWAEYQYIEGRETGVCKLYYRSGKLFYYGYLINGFRNGKGTEYDETGKIIFDGFFKDGSRNPVFLRRWDHENYWNEVDDNGTLVSICQKDDLGQNYGICYFFNDGVINHISKWKNGKEAEMLYMFEGAIMVKYKKGKEKYRGKYMRKSDFEYIPYYGRYIIAISSRRIFSRSYG